MNQVSHQTARLAKGRHSSPEDGVCVMELASMLAGEPFTDRPTSVAPSIATFLRAYNDLLDDERRQDLYAYAAMTVGTSGALASEQARLERLIAWGDEMRSRRPRWALTRWLRPRRGRNFTAEKPEVAAMYAIGTIRRLSDDTHAAVLKLVDQLISIGASGPQGTRLSEPQPQRNGARCRRVGDTFDLPSTL